MSSDDSDSDSASLYKEDRKLIFNELKRMNTNLETMNTRQNRMDMNQAKLDTRLSVLDARTAIYAVLGGTAAMAFYHYVIKAATAA